MYMDDYFATIKHIVDTLALAKNLVELNDFVGIVGTKSQNGLHFSQPKYIVDILAKNDMASYNAMPTPMSILQKIMIIHLSTEALQEPYTMLPSPDQK